MAKKNDKLPRVFATGKPFRPVGDVRYATVMTWSEFARKFFDCTGDPILEIHPFRLRAFLELVTSYWGEAVAASVADCFVQKKATGLYQVKENKSVQEVFLDTIKSIK